jgi:hypothetical protein
VSCRAKGQRQFSLIFTLLCFAFLTESGTGMVKYVTVFNLKGWYHLVNASKKLFFSGFKAFRQPPMKLRKFSHPCPK